MDDVAIVGGGPAGALAAIVLARAGVGVRLFDRARFPRPKLCGDTLNPGGCRTLAHYLPVDALRHHARPIDGMLLTGPGRVCVRGRYGDGISGLAIERRVLDQWLIDQAAASGAQVEQDSAIEEAIVEEGRVTGVSVRSARAGASRRHPARLVIAADGRHSRLAFALGLAHHPPRPRRWAIGAYFEGVDGSSTAGEMHVRGTHYIGVAPMPGGITNACLVVPHGQGSAGWRDAAALLTTHLDRDPLLGPRFARARMIDAPTTLGPMAVDVTTPGTRGLLLAGDAAGFIDPMTGDGLTFALRGSAIAAQVAIDVLNGTVSEDAAVPTLARRREQAFAAKWRFNRALRLLVSSPRAVSAAAVAARTLPSAFAAMIRYAGDASS